jgi:hypothetical protein
MASSKERPQSSRPSTADGKKAKPGAAWKDGETHVLPHNNLPVVFTAFMCCTFLAALDQVSLSFVQLNCLVWIDFDRTFVCSVRLDHRRDRIADDRP